MNSKNKKTISLLLGGFIALIILACSAPVENNSNGTPQNVEISPTVHIPHTPTKEFTPTARPTKTETPSPTPNVAKETEYLQMREELNQFDPLLKLLESPDGHKTNGLIDYNTYEFRLLKKYIGYFLELACNRPELLKDLKFEPFYLGTPYLSSNLDINVQECKISRETLAKLEENGHMIILSHPIFSEGADTSLTALFPSINGKAFKYSYDGKSFDDFYNSLLHYGGMAFGSVNYPEYVFEMSLISSDPEMIYAVAKFNRSLPFSIPSNPDGTMAFSSIMIIPNGTSASEIDKMVTRNTAIPFAMFSTKIWFTSDNFPKD